MDSEVNVHALLFADRIIVENNGEKGLIGVFASFSFPAFPVQAPLWYIYIALDNIRSGKHTFTLNMVKDPSQQVVFSGSAGFENPDKAGGAELVLPIAPLQFPAAGWYLISVVVDDKELKNRFLHVLASDQIRGKS